MKRSIKKLRVTKETLLNLTSRQLGRVVGGAPSDWKHDSASTTDSYPVHEQPPLIITEDC